MDKKSLFFIGSGFHEYDNYIVEHLKKEYDVWYLCSSEYYLRFPHYQGLVERFPKIFPDINDRSITKYIENTRNKDFDIIFTIKGAHLTENHLSKLKKYHNRARFVLYVWDAWKIINNRDLLIHYFPKILSFDSEDCKQYGFTLRPLFYIERSNEENKKTIDVSFVGGNHSNRLSTIAEIKKLCIKNKLTYRFIIPSTLSQVLKTMLLSYNFYKNNKDLITRNNVTYEEFLKITRRSKTVIDIHFTKQSGLTMRTIEALAVGTKVVTTNEHIREYENIPSSMYYVWDMKVNQALEDFIKEEVSDFKIDPQYHINSFLADILK